ncbi:MAG TPA: VOC family protein [Candidatus Margulisiibacteriota bacterium]|nr:VOC family protein [Candidatus Margulisiibacteriota bacterium]
MARIDHIVIGVRDLETSAALIWERYGLEAQPGGTHTGAGTANLLVPLANDQFLELLTITDHLSRHPIVGWLSRLLTDGDRLIALAVEPDDLEAAAARLGEPVIEQDRVAADGRRVHFRLTGTRGLLGPEILPFFVETTTGREWRCGFRPARHRADIRGVRWVELGGDETRIREQVACAALPIRVVNGRAGVTAVGLDGGDRELVMRF